ncbi:hypothetical protein MWG03_03070 [Fusobacterium necrophorum]|uniref:nicotianamine synthase family protein n=1 Tax=Fusobacterium necrophorum TaxID=859 RepID=UPI0025500813|nr:nicotianamine synthase family protein [Fusobacterium necrophorum]MDK4501313.1 hypothetical protein [Fusobacterium necrophorum]
MLKHELFMELDKFITDFKILNEKAKNNLKCSKEIEEKLGDFTNFILNKEYEKIWDSLDENILYSLKDKIDTIREVSAHSVWFMEKFRAKAFLKNSTTILDYFKNIEECIETEFKGFTIDSKSKVLLIGAGSFPMTLLAISKKTGAKAVGIDIDNEAVELASKIINILGKDLDIEIHNLTFDNLPFTYEATHIIFASTIKEKFEILEKLHDKTGKDVVVGMRYGDGLKSLFNYPLEEINSSLWKKVSTVYHPNNIFDVALYKKSNI